MDPSLTPTTDSDHGGRPLEADRPRSVRNARTCTRLVPFCLLSGRRRKRPQRDRPRRFRRTRAPAAPRGAGEGGCCVGTLRSTASSSWLSRHTLSGQAQECPAARLATRVPLPTALRHKEFHGSSGSRAGRRCRSGGGGHAPAPDRGAFRFAAARARARAARPLLTRPSYGAYASPARARAGGSGRRRRPPRLPAGLVRNHRRGQDVACHRPPDGPGAVPVPALCQAQSRPRMEPVAPLTPPRGP